MGYSEISPWGVMRPNLRAVFSVNQNAPSARAAKKPWRASLAPGVGIGYSVSTPPVVIRPIWLAAVSLAPESFVRLHDDTAWQAAIARERLFGELDARADALHLDGCCLRRGMAMTGP